MATMPPIRYQFEPALRQKPLSTLLDLLTSASPVAATDDPRPLLRAVYDLQWLFVNHPDVLRGDAVTTLLDRDDWLHWHGLEAEDRARLRKMQAYLNSLVAYPPPAPLDFGGYGIDDS